MCCSNTIQTVCPCLAMFKHFEQCSDIMHCFTCCSNTVQTVFGHVILPVHAFEQCSNNLSLFGNVQTLFESVRTSRTASRAVRTLFGQCLDMLYSLSMHSNSVRTAHHAVVCCSNTVRTICPCLAMFEHFEQCSNRTLMPTTRGESFLFLFPFSFSLFFLFTAIHVRPQVHPCTPIRNTSTRPSAHSEHQ